MGYYKKNMLPSEKNTSAEDTTVAERPNKKAVMRTYAMDVAVAKHGTNTIPTASTKKPLSIPLPPTVQNTAIPKQIPSAPPPPIPSPSQIEEKIEALKSVVPTPINTTLSAPKQTYTPASPQAHTKNMRGIPVHLEIAHRNQISESKSTLSNVWEWLTSSGEVNKHGGIKIREDIAMPIEQKAEAYIKPDEPLEKAMSKITTVKPAVISPIIKTEAKPTIPKIIPTTIPSAVQQPVIERQYKPAVPKHIATLPETLPERKQVVKKPEIVNSSPGNTPQTILPPTVSPLHTYKMDIADTIKETEASTTSILAKQQDTNPLTNTAPEKEKRTLLWLAIGGALLLMISIIGTGYAYQYHVKKVAPAQITRSIPSLVSTNMTKELFGTGNDLLKALSQVSHTTLQDSIIKTVYIATSTKENNGVIEKHPLPGGYLIAAMHMPIPTILINNTAVDSTVGVVGANNKTYPFFILRVASYDSAFAGMLRWESSIASDMQVLYPAPIENTPTSPSATSTVTQTPSSAKQTPVTTMGFVDETVANHNVRVLRNLSGQSIMLYGFANKNTLIIARDADAFSVLLGKLSQK